MVRFEGTEMDVRGVQNSADPKGIALDMLSIFGHS